MTRSQLRRGKRVKGEIIVAAVLFVALLAGCSAETNGASQVWLTQTALLTGGPVEQRNDELFIQVYDDPPGGEFNPYRTASALAALGSQAPVNADVSEKLKEEISRVPNSPRIGTPLIYTLEMIVRADKLNPFLSESDRVDVVHAAEALVSTDPPQDAVDWLTVARIDSSLASTGVAAGCDETARDPFSILASRATADLMGQECDPTDATWFDEIERLSDDLRKASHSLTMLDCDTVAALASSVRSEERSVQLVAVFNLAAEKLRVELTDGEPTACLASLQLAARLLGVEGPKLTVEQRELMQWQLRGGGPPVVIPVTSWILQGVNNIATAAGKVRPGSSAEEAWHSAQLQAPMIGSQSLDVEGYANDLAERIESEPSEEARFALTTLVESGDDACVFLSHDQLFRAVSRTGSLSEYSLNTSIALRLLGDCKIGSVKHRVDLEVIKAQKTLEHVEDATIASAYQAQAVLCALAPEKMEESALFWSAFSGNISEYGGILSDGLVDMQSTIKLASLLHVDKAECEEGKLLW